MCHLDSFWYIHGLVWHPLLNIAMVAQYLYWKDVGGLEIQQVEERGSHFLVSWLLPALIHQVEGLAASLTNLLGELPGLR